MGIVELATVALIASKVYGIGMAAHWPWLKVLMPEIIMIIFYFIIFIFGCCVVASPLPRRRF